MKKIIETKPDIWGETLKIVSVFFFFYKDSPLHWDPLPVNPAWHEHWNDPGLSWQVALAWQGEFTWPHSSMFLHTVPLPEYPTLHLQWNAPTVSVQIAFFWHGEVVSVHSLIFLQSVPLPLYPSLHVQGKRPRSVCAMCIGVATMWEWRTFIIVGAAWSILFVANKTLTSKWSNSVQALCVVTASTLLTLNYINAVRFLHGVSFFACIWTAIAAHCIDTGRSFGAIVSFFAFIDIGAH